MKDGLQFVGELVALQRPTEQEMVQAAASGKGAPSWNLRVEARDHRGDVIAIAGFFEGFDVSGQQTPLLLKLREWFGEPTEQGEVRLTGTKVRVYFQQGITQSRKLWFRISDAELVESSASVSNNGKKPLVAAAP